MIKRVLGMMIDDTAQSGKEIRLTSLSSCAG